MKEPIRDPERVILALRAVMEADPSLRVGQAIGIATHRVHGHFDPFSTEDDRLAEALERMAEEYRRRPGR
jgi:hypothetical protein